MPIMYPTLQMTKNIANDAFSTRFDDGLGWGSVSGTLGEEEAFPIRKGWLKHA